MQFILALLTVKGPPDPCLFCQHGQIALPVACYLYIPHLPLPLSPALC